MSELDKSIEPGEIVHCNMYFKSKDGNFVAEKRVFSRDYDKPVKTEFTLEKDSHFLKSVGAKNNITLVKVDVIKSLGFKVRYNDVAEKASSTNIINQREEEQKEKSKVKRKKTKEQSSLF